MATNRRAYFLVGSSGLSLAAASIFVLAWRGLDGTHGWWIAFLAIAGIVVGMAAFWSSRNPRIGFNQRDELLFFIASGRPFQSVEPIRVPLDIVECFFLGQGPSGVQNRSATAVEEELECKNIVVRLAESAVDWQHGATNRRVARWCDGYITLVGTWCEPISTDLLGRMNHRLAEAKRRRKEASVNESKVSGPTL